MQSAILTLLAHATSYHWKSNLLLFFALSFLVLIPLEMSNAAPLDKADNQTSPLSPLVSPLKMLASTDEAKNPETESASTINAKAAAGSVSLPIVIGTEANQISFALLGAVLIGLIIVVGLILGRRN